MVERETQAAADAGAPLVLYDGTCGFCHTMVRFVLAHDGARAFRFAALQSEAAARALAPFGGVPADLTTFYLIEGPPGRRVLRSRADGALAVARTLGWPWRAAGALRVFPRAWLDRAYDFVARNRHRILGAAEACPVPRPEDRARFLDAGEGGRS